MSYKPSRGRMIILFLKKVFRFKSPSIAGATFGKYIYEYDYFKERYRR